MDVSCNIDDKYISDFHFLLEPKKYLFQTIRTLQLVIIGKKDEYLLIAPVIQIKSEHLLHLHYFDFQLDMLSPQRL